MGYPRAHQIRSSSPATYHCVSRCVRRAYLCGQDLQSGRSFDHRRQWIEDRLLELAEIFSASVLAYAVMSNHVHVVVRMDPEAVRQWSDEVVAERWIRLFPVTRNGQLDLEGCTQGIANLLGNPQRLAVLRERLGSLSWFMRCLSEPVARRANREDECSGRFWEGRFRSQLLLDDRAVLACMSYVDLNPLRAGTADSLAASAHTSIQRRLRSRENSPMNAVAGSDTAGMFVLSSEEYIALVEWTGRRLHPRNDGTIVGPAPRIVLQSGKEASWLAQVRGTERCYWRAIGSLEALAERARSLGQHWLKGGRNLQMVT